jgi:DNA polymerase-1
MEQQVESKCALIDADILLYRVGFTTEDVDEPIAKYRMAEMITRILDVTGANEAMLYLSPGNQASFRYRIAPDYKANRKDKPKPKHYKFLRDFLKSEFLAITGDDEEADDSLGVALSSDKEGTSILVSIDKDLDQIAGWHFNFVTEETYKISPLEGARVFYTQLLVGDTSDNIEGCPKVGKITAARLLEGCETEKEMYEVCLKAYKRAFKNDLRRLFTAERILKAGSLLWIRRKNGLQWNINGEVVSKELLEMDLES